MKRKTLEVVRSSREYTHRYVEEWAKSKASCGCVETSGIFGFFPGLREGIVGKQVLDIGCAEGSFVRLLNSLGAHAKGIDLFGGPSGPETVRGDFMSYPFGQTGGFDIIFAMNVFETDAIYRPMAMNFSQDENSFQRGMRNRSSPRAMLVRLRELLSKEGFCIFSIATSPLIFTKENARDAGFVLKRYRRAIDTSKYGTPPNYPNYSIVSSAEDKFVLAGK